MAAKPESLDDVNFQQALDMAARVVRGVWLYRWAGMAVAWSTCILTWGYVMWLPNTYQASTRVFVDTETVLKPLLRGLAVETDVTSSVAIMTRAIMSRPNLERVARKNDLDVAATTPTEYDDLLASLAERIQISANAEKIYTIQFVDPSRERALSMVRTLLDTFVEDSLGSGHEDSAQAERALKAEISDYEQRLVQAEDRLKEFKRKNVGMIPNERGDYYGQLQAASTDLEASQQALRVAEQRRAALQRQIGGEEPSFGIVPSTLVGGGGTSSVDSQIATIEHKLTDLQMEFTDKHPEVIRANQLLADLRQRREQELKARADMGSVNPVTGMLDLNPVYQSMKIQLSAVQVDIAALQEDVADKKARVDRLKKLVDVVPEVEAELNQLNRDYEVVKSRYGTMLGRWEDLQTSRRVNSGTDQIQFRIIDPPFADMTPVGPKRPLFVAGAAAFAIAAGLGLAMLLNLVRPVLSTMRDLTHFGVPVLGSVSARQSVAELARAHRDRIYLVACAAALLTASILVMVFANSGALLLQSLIAHS